jgi:hypothetical protein
MKQMNIDDVRVIVDDTIRRLQPADVAELFANMASDEQALFFNRLAVVTSEWKAGLPFQLKHLTDEEALTSEARAVMRLIGEYSQQTR